MAADYYELLGVASRRHAPTRSSGPTAGWPASSTRTPTRDPAAEARFKEIALAYEVLSDPEKRQRYDLFGRGGARAAVAGTPSAVRRHRRHLRRLLRRRAAAPSAEVAAPGPAGPPRERTSRWRSTSPSRRRCSAPAARDRAHRGACETCEATGAAPGTEPQRCPECAGAGQVRRVRQSILGQMVTAAPCAALRRHGQVITEPVRDCGGEGRTVEERTYTVDIPAGVDTGSTLRLSGRGAVGPRGGPAGDLYVHVRVTPHERFTRDGDDLVAIVPDLGPGRPRRPPRVRHARRRRGPRHPRGHPDRQRRPAAGPRRAPRPGPGPGRPARALVVRRRRT